MKPGIQSLWIILTVMIPGLVFYGVFRILTAILGIQPVFLADFESSEGVFICMLFAVMFILQIFGIAVESIAFKIGPYKHDDPDYQEAFDNRYEIIGTMDPDKDYHVERILGQFFMSHNIAVGMVINLSWLVIYEFFVVCRFDMLAVMTTIIFLAITLTSLYVPYNRFFQSCKVLYAHINKHKRK